MIYFRQIETDWDKYGSFWLYFCLNFRLIFGVKKNFFFGSHDPSTLNQQGPDRGTQYRSVAFYSNEVEQKIINDKIDELLEMKIFKIITTEVKKFEKFYLAEEYHQDYKKKNPYNPYIMKVSAPRINKFKLNYSELLKDN